MPTTQNNKTPSRAPGLTAQRKHIDHLHQTGFDYSVVVAEAFVRGIRDIGYRHTGTAIDELIDNSIQAGAETVMVTFGFTGTSEKKPTALAVLDDGHGMDPDMIRLSMIWGGTHRENDRSGFGRYGFGLPSASMSQGKRFTVFSRTGSGPFQAVSFSLVKLAEGHYSHDGRVVIPEPTEGKLPRWVIAAADEKFGGGKKLRTAVVVEDLDGLSWKTETGLMRNLLPHLGVTYRNLLRNVEIWVEDTKTEPIDPLFLTEGARFYGLDKVRARALPPKVIDVRTEDGETAQIKVRYSLMPPTFQRDKENSQKTNARFEVMKDHNGLIVLRNGRQLDIVTRTPWPDVTTFVNYDRNIGVEVDFPAALDEEFRVTTSKQQVVLSERIWDILDKNGVRAAIKQLRADFKELRRKDRAAKEEADKEGKRTSEEVMQAAEKFKTKKPSENPERVQEAEENERAEVERRARESGVPADQIESQLRAGGRGASVRDRRAFVAGSALLPDRAKGRPEGAHPQHRPPVLHRRVRRSGLVTEAPGRARAVDVRTRRGRTRRIRRPPDLLPHRARRVVEQAHDGPRTPRALRRRARRGGRGDHRRGGRRHDLEALDIRIVREPSPYYGATALRG